MKTNANDSTAENSNRIKTKNQSIMKQPELGQKISELRKSKGLTQEELVEQCNISVRTIQRIEAGEVTPRSYTVRTILDVLDYDLSILKQEEHQATTEFKQLLLLDVEDTKEATYLIQHLNAAWIFGIVFFFVTIPEMYADFRIVSDNEYVFSKLTYTIIKLLVIVSYIFFFRGIILTGKLFQNYLLKISAFIMIVMAIVFYLYDIIALHIDLIDHTYMLVTESLCFGIVGILFGIALLRLGGSLQMLGKVSGILEIIAAATFLTVILGFIGLGAWSAAIIVEIILLYKVSQMLKVKLGELATS
ncbi:helix-turn-helix transcriptional regulator [Aquimarina sp. MMG016]|uniref:helix-turn-helix domain-containing protein n=1 Tax=Aquimarina sp. MMG016 TaxID=2822690 RepID=UPI001B3A1517|nr:helix-turn-helix transcriptional regulator [Aquimarina sp. MMG016]MBQ4818952.1 helix-turn-helix transcriptional regulator [Aquimarina sp. MMG016]